MAKTSAGLLVFRRDRGGLEVLLVHPGGPFWKNKDAGAWSIPKGEYEPGDDPFQAAIREFAEETGIEPEGELLELQEIRQAGGKRVRAWALEGGYDPGIMRSNTFEMEWPPKSGRKQSFPEVDRAAWFRIDEARQKILASQAPLLDQLQRRLV